MQSKKLFLNAVLLIGVAACGTPAAPPEKAEIVLLGGRVMDPETGLDEIRNVGIVGGRIVSVTQESIDANETIDVAEMSERSLLDFGNRSDVPTRKQRRGPDIRLDSCPRLRRLQQLPPRSLRPG